MINITRAGFHIVLYEPEIPANTGNIGRICVGTGSTLHIIQPCKFLLTDKALKRAGLDYWPRLDLILHKDIGEIFGAFPQKRIFLCTTKAESHYCDVRYEPGDIFVFGPESCGLPQNLLDGYPEQLITIPMSDKIRSYNLSNSVSIVLFEAIRQVSRLSG
ncbi:MAG: tRNA (cytidine(34)-2'-O)-methyltransferase [Candidatus Syntrophosphaera sp.]